MNESEKNFSIISSLEQAGYKAKFMPLSVLSDLQKEILDIRKEVKEIVFEERLSFLEFSIPDNFPNAKSLLITAAPQFRVKLSFSLEGRTYFSTVPPTYSHATDNSIKNLLCDLLKSRGHSFSPTKLPEKLLGYIAGMTGYGRNNITYMKEFGSFFRLKSFYTDISCDESVSYEFSMMDECRRCTACVRACPTKAISKDKFLIDASKCLTFINESVNDFPEWVNSDWHKCLFGCMNCQLKCPLNLEFANYYDSEISFNEHETRMILDAVPRNQLSKSVTEKLQKLSLLDDYNLIPRNLRAIIKLN